MQQSVVKVGSGHIDVVRKLVAPFEGTSSDPAMEIGCFAGLGGLFAGDGQRVLLDLKLELFRRETCDR